MRPLAVLVLLLALSLAACGDDESAPASPIAAPTETPRSVPNAIAGWTLRTALLHRPDAEVRVVNADGTGDAGWTGSTLAGREVFGWERPTSHCILGIDGLSG